MTGTQPLYALPNASMVPPAQEQLTPSWPLVQTNQTGLQSGYTQAYTLASQLLTLPKLCSRTSRQVLLPYRPSSCLSALKYATSPANRITLDEFSVDIASAATTPTGI